MPIVRVGNTAFLERGILPKDEWDKIKREEAMKIHKEIMATSGQMADEDPQVGWNYKQDWRTSPLPERVVFGSDYDYWNHVVLEARRLWYAHVPEIAHDFIAEKIAKEEAPWSVGFYAEQVQVWENGKPVGFGTKLKGPRVDFGPTADFAAFLEQWDYSKSTQPVRVDPLYGIGLMHFIARELQTTFRGIHTIFVMPIKPTDTSEVRETPNRTKPVETFPIIRIVSRHYRR